MPTTLSKDGTKIGFDREGTGPALVLVDGAMCYRTSGPAKPLAALLTDRFTVYTYDRRGRGESTDTLPYSLDREIEDLEAVIAEAGGSAYVYGISSGAALAAAAANRLPGIRKLVLYEAPFIVDNSHSPLPSNFLDQLKHFVATDKRGEAVKLFMRRVGMPSIAIFVFQFLPVWKKLVAIAHTLVYDISIIKTYSQGRPLPAGDWAGVQVPVIVADGGKSPRWMRNAAEAWSKVFEQGAYRTLPGQTHMLKPQAIAPVLIEFFQ